MRKISQRRWYLKTWKMREIGLLKDKFTNYWIKRMDVFHQDIATATNVIVKRRSLQQSEHWDFSGRFLFCKIIYSCTESHHVVLEKQRGVQFIPRSQPKNYASVVFRRSQNITQVWTKGSSCVKQVESDVYRYWSAVGNKEVKGLWRLKVSTNTQREKRLTTSTPWMMYI